MWVNVADHILVSIYVQFGMSDNHNGHKVIIGCVRGIYEGEGESTAAF